MIWIVLKWDLIGKWIIFKKTMSYKYLTKREIKPIRSKLYVLLAKLVTILKNKEEISAQCILVGSGARNMITSDNNENIIDFDYNLKIFKWKDKRITRACVLSTKNKAILKQKVMDIMNEVFHELNLEYVQDSTSVITTKAFVLEAKNVSVDLAIICEDDTGYIYRLVHTKNCNKNDEYRFEQIKDIDEKYKEKIHWLKKNHKWDKVRVKYLKLKNEYGRKKQSISIYAEAIANVYNEYKNQSSN